ncbi:MAG: hypothetical protein ACYTX0_61185, partial [Nostoc sp.]
RNPTYIRMLALAKPPTPLATTRETRATQWLPNLQFVLQLYTKRNFKVDDYLHKVSRYLINKLIELNI